MTTRRSIPPLLPLGVVFSLAAASTPAWAQTPAGASFSEEQLQAQLNLVRQQGAPEVVLPDGKQSISPEAITAAIKQQRERSDQALARVAPGAIRPQVPPGGVRATLPIPDPAGSKAQAADDLARIASYYNQQIHGPQQGAQDSPELLIFVTMAMPRPALIALAKQAERVGAVLVLRGLRGASWKDTFDAISSIQKSVPNAKWQINPPAFTKFRVTVAPTVVLAIPAEAATPASDGCAPAGSYASVVGDVSLDYALEQIAKTAPRFSDAAGAWLARLR